MKHFERTRQYQAAIDQVLNKWRPTVEQFDVAMADMIKSQYPYASAAEHYERFRTDEGIRQYRQHLLECIADEIGLIPPSYVCEASQAIALALSKGLD